MKDFPKFIAIYQDETAIASADSGGFGERGIKTLIVSGNFTKDEKNILIPILKVDGSCFKIKTKKIKEYCEYCNGRGSWEGREQDCTIHTCDSCKGRRYLEKEYSIIEKTEIPEPQIEVLGRKVSRTEALKIAKKIMEDAEKERAENDR